VEGVLFETVSSIATVSEIKRLWPVLPSRKMRVCFDLDNTLVTFPVIPNDYSSVKPIQKMIDLAKQLHSDGHTIIVYTARRMLTHKNNLGAVIKDIGPITFKTLSDFSIPYDELIFGKPYADIYIDDKGLNPYFNDISDFGYFSDIGAKKPMNSLNANKFNTLKLTEAGYIEKTGPIKTLRGEIYYYKHLPEGLNQYFPKYINSSDDRLVIEHIKGIPVFSLYRANLVTKLHIDRLCEFLDILHSFKGVTINPPIDSENIRNNYKQKLIGRFAVKEDYPFEDAAYVQERCLESLERYIDGPISTVDYIHGDFWFSNIIFDFNGMLKAIDMKGQVDGVLTTSGDPIYDYGKLYQSILGYDCVLNGVSLPANNEELKEYFEAKVGRSGLKLESLRAVTFALVLGTLPFIETYEAKLRVWSWIKERFILGVAS
jgi:capsule biosynthesis phosphatase